MNYNKKENTSAPLRGVYIPDKSINHSPVPVKVLSESVKGLSIVRQSLTKSGFKEDSKEVGRIDYLITKHRSK
jgi:hypothetical protein